MKKHKHAWKKFGEDSVGRYFYCKCGDYRTEWTAKINMKDPLPAPLLSGQVERNKRRRVGGPRWY